MVTKKLSVSAIILSGALVAPVWAQDSSAASQNAQATAATQTQPNGTYATGQPLEVQSHEGFWGHMNPFARKKWVHRQLDPVKDRVNELDEVQAKNAADIKDVDARATAGINRATDAANAADQKATEAGQRADAANTLATNTSGRADALHGTVQNLDQYSPVTAKNMSFAAGRTTLTAKQKKNLDEMAEALASEKGYIIEVQGYSRNGVNSSQAMADSVVRYLVAEHQVPIYRIYRTGLGHTKFTDDETGKSLSNGVRVAVMQNSLASMDTQATNNAPASPSKPAAPTASY